MAEQCLSDNFNEECKADIFKRNMEADPEDDPILIKNEGNRVLVHVDTSFLEELDGQGEGKLQSFGSVEALESQLGPIENIRTYDQLKAEAGYISKTPGLGSKLEETKDFMNSRVQEIQGDMSKNGEVFEVKAPGSVIESSFGQ